MKPIVFHSITEKVNPEHFEKHCHSQMELLYIIQGKGKIISEQSIFDMQPNTLAIFPAYRYHYVRVDENTCYERMVINVDETDVADALMLFNASESKKNEMFYVLDDDPFVKTSMLALDKISMQNEVGNILLYDIVKSILLYVTALPTSEINENKKDILVYEITEYINTHLLDKLSLEDLAKRMYISKFYMCRKFREYMGISIYSYYNTKRIALAQKKILEGENPTNIAKKMQFEDYSTFYKLYRKQTGNSPKRKNNMTVDHR